MYLLARFYFLSSRKNSNNNNRNEKLTETSSSVCLLLATALCLDWLEGLKFFCMYLFVYERCSFSVLTILLLVIASDVINVTLVITSEECTDGEYNQLWEKLSKMVTNLFM